MSDGGPDNASAGAARAADLSQSGSGAIAPSLLAYADRISVAPGDALRCMVSAELPRYSAALVRLVHGDTNPAGPGFIEVPIASTIDGDYTGRRQSIAAGSYVRVPHDLRFLDSFTIQAWVWPTLPADDRGQALFSCWSDAERRGFVFGLDESGRLCLELGCGDGATVRVVHISGGAVARWRWAFVAVVFSRREATVRLYLASAEPSGSHDLHEHAEGVGHLPPLALPRPDLLIAARSLDGPRGLYNGKLERPRLFGRALASAEIVALHNESPQAALPMGCIGDWDFAADIGSSRVTDRSARAQHGYTLNGPMRGVTDHTWGGRELRWAGAPEQYAAMHFHDDDLEDAGWRPDFTFNVPVDLPSGIYAFRLASVTSGRHVNSEEEQEYVPFFVRPRRGTATAEVAFLAPTLTYQAYANERLYWGPRYRERRGLFTPLETEPPDIDAYMAEHRELGLSLYDLHRDGSGCAYSSRLRPILNMRPKYRAWRLHNAPRHFAADLYLVGWLTARGLPFDVITDEDLHQEGSALLGRYRVVLTGSHPEYVTEAMHVGTREYLHTGGRLMYLGGNGFYWVTTIDPERPHVIELRRGASGTRTWESLPGETYHSTTGEPGGLWRLRGYAPQRLLGVGFAAQGWGGASGYRQLAASRNPRAAFVFDGISSDEVIGDFGLVLGGAAGDEIDRYDIQLGSPEHGLVLATSAGQHTDYYQVTSEDVPVTVPGQGGTQSPRVRADMVFFETPAGGAVFSVGSINWLGSLGWNGYSNNVARVTENVLRRFLDPRPFPYPGPGAASA